MPEDNQQPVIGYADAADQYWRQGWRGVLPLRRGRKIAPPAGFTGKAGVEPSYPDVMSWAELYPDGNLCLRMADGVIGIDVDAYGAKTGAAALTEAQQRWGALPETVLTTSREDGVSGIRFYRIPAGVELVESIEFPDLGVGDIEIVQRHHRYALAWPSIHPEGRGYWWRNTDNQIIGIPAVDELPELPAAWLEALRAPARAQIAVGSYSATEALTAGEPSGAVAERLRQAIKELNLPGSSRHDTARGHVLALMRLGKRGEPGVEPALRALGEMFIALVTPDRPGGRDEAEREYRSMVVGPGAGRELAKPSNTDWISTVPLGDLTEGSAAPTLQPAPAADVAGDDPTVSRHHRSELQQRLEEVEHGFWNSRESLRTVFDAAIARFAPPWGVLAVTVARVLCLVPPHIVLPPIVGGVGSLNSFFCLTSPSGGGKGASVAVAKELIPAYIFEAKLGSGEGFIKILEGNPKEPDSRPGAVWFDAGEIDGIKAMGDRIGSTLLEKLRDAWMGASLGFGYKDSSFVEAHSYRMTLTVGVQPRRAGWLLADGGGTPQRFMWFPAMDERANRVNRRRYGDHWVPALTLPSALKFQYPRTLVVPPEVKESIEIAQEMKNFGRTDGLDTHAAFAREKFAQALAMIDGRTEMTAQDWSLAGVATEVSALMREFVTTDLRQALVLDAEDRGALRGVEMHAADLEKEQRQIEQVARVSRWVLRRLRDADDIGVTQTDLSLAVAGRDRRCLNAMVLQKLATEGLIRCETVEGSVTWWLR